MAFDHSTVHSRDSCSFRGMDFDGNQESGSRDIAFALNTFA